MMSLVSWLRAPPPDRGVRFATDRGSWQRVTYAELAEDALSVGGGLAARGIGPGDVVTVAMPASRECLAAMFGTWAAGATVCMLPAPGFSASYPQTVEAIVSVARPAVTFGDGDAVSMLPYASPLSFGAQLGSVTPTEGVAAVQFTSGSTGAPRGIELTWDNLASNIAVITRLTGYRDGDGGSSWLPLNHDMGFVGALVTISGGDDLWLMRPDQFARSPRQWLESLSSEHARHTAAPPFGYAYAARRASFDGLDLSSWRTALVGAAAISPAVLTAFATAAAPAGFRLSAFMPAYGLAENTVAVTATHLRNAIRPDWSALRFGSPVTVLDTGLNAAGDGWLVGHGLPALGDGIEVIIESAPSVIVPEGSLGEIVVSGSSVARGYTGHPSFGGKVRTGDAGFVLGGDLYVLGRMGESLKVRGRSVYVEDLDGRAAAAAGFERVAVVAVNDGGQPGVAVFAEATPGPWVAQVTAALRAELGPEPVITVIAGRRGLIKRTSSGKPRRREMWRLWSAGELPGAPAHEGHR
jgi:acyl-CoA synthetase (AMP-forming)/AMP-acid ligase II